MSEVYISLPYGESGYVTIPNHIRERYLTESTESCVVQAIGPELQLTFVPKMRSSFLQIRIELETPYWGDCYKRKLSRGSVHIDRWDEYLAVEDEEEGKRRVHATIQTIDE